MRVEVRDAGDPYFPRSAQGWDLTAEGGRGLDLVQALATAWGSTVHQDKPIGKTMWFEIVRGRSVPADSG